MITRRTLLGGLLCAPALVRASSLDFIPRSPAPEAFLINPSVPEVLSLTEFQKNLVWVWETKGGLPEFLIKPKDSPIERFIK